MPGFVVVVADSSVARLYTMATRAGVLKPGPELHNPAAHQRSRDLGADRPARAVNAASGVRHALESHQDLKQAADEQFARKVVAAVARAARDPGKPGIVLVVGARLLGQYRKLLPAELRARVAAEVPRSLTKAELAEVTERVRGALRPAPVTAAR
jgi:protein required for attachment to host cells